jgi:propanol-preferring alcohol dehydrogenase
MPKTMRAAVVESFGQPLTIKELPIPAPGPGQVLMEVVSSGVCHTDLHAADGDWPVKPNLPFPRPRRCRIRGGTGVGGQAFKGR